MIRLRSVDQQPLIDLDPGRRLNFYFLGVVFFSGLILWLYHPGQQPILGDRAYFLYMTQALLRGEALYQTTTFGYPPVGIFLTAFSMWLGQLAGLPFYLLPRLVGIVVAALSCGSLFRVTHHRFRSVELAIIAAVSLLTIQRFLVYSVSNLEPKMIVLLLAILVMRATQKRAWLRVGIWGALAAFTWQPALIILIPPFLLILFEMQRGKENFRSLLLFFAGVFSVVLGIVGYLIWTGQPLDFLSQAVLFKLRSRNAFESSAWVRLVTPVAFLLGYSGIPVFLLSLTGIVSSIWKVTKEEEIISIKFASPDDGGLVFHTAVWLGYHLLSSFSSIEAHSFFDLIPSIYLFGLWAAAGWQRAALKIPSRSGRQKNKKLMRRVNLVGVLFFGALAVWMAGRYEVGFTIAEQQAEVSSVKSRQAAGQMLAINTPEFYVFTQQKSPWPTFYTTDYFVEYLTWRYELTCDDLIVDIEKKKYSLIVYNERLDYSRCSRDILISLDKLYDSEQIKSEMFTTTVSCGVTKAVKSLQVDHPLTWLRSELFPAIRCALVRYLPTDGPQYLGGSLHIFTIRQDEENN